MKKKITQRNVRKILKRIESGNTLFNAVQILIAFFKNGRKKEISPIQYIFEDITFSENIILNCSDRNVILSFQNCTMLGDENTFIAEEVQIQSCSFLSSTENPLVPKDVKIKAKEIYFVENTIEDKEISLTFIAENGTYKKNCILGSTLSLSLQENDTESSLWEDKEEKGMQALQELSMKNKIMVSEIHIKDLLSIYNRGPQFLRNSICFKGDTEVLFNEVCFEANKKLAFLEKQKVTFQNCSVVLSKDSMISDFKIEAGSILLDNFKSIPAIISSEVKGISLSLRGKNIETRGALFFPSVNYYNAKKIDFLGCCMHVDGLNIFATNAETNIQNSTLFARRMHLFGDYKIEKSKLETTETMIFSHMSSLSQVDKSSVILGGEGVYMKNSVKDNIPVERRKGVQEQLKREREKLEANKNNSMSFSFQKKKK